MCIVVDICDTLLLQTFFSLSPGWSANKRVGKVTRLSYPITDGRHSLGNIEQHNIEYPLDIGRLLCGEAPFLRPPPSRKTSRKPADIRFSSARLQMPVCSATVQRHAALAHGHCRAEVQSMAGCARADQPQLARQPEARYRLGSMNSDGICA